MKIMNKKVMKMGMMMKNKEMKMEKIMNKVNRMNKNNNQVSNKNKKVIITITQMMMDHRIARK